MQKCLNLNLAQIVSFRSGGKNQAKDSRQPASVSGPASSVTPPRNVVSLNEKFFSFIILWYHTFRASLVAQLVKNLPAMWETWV